MLARCATVRRNAAVISQLCTAEAEDHEGKRKTESIWPIMRIAHTRSRYIYDLYYKREAISKELYDWLLDQGYADAACVMAGDEADRTA